MVWLNDSNVYIDNALLDSLITDLMEHMKIIEYKPIES